MASRRVGSHTVRPDWRRPVRVPALWRETQNINVSEQSALANMTEEELPVRRQLGVAHRVLDVTMVEPGLQRPREQVCSQPTFGLSVRGHRQRTQGRRVCQRQLVNEALGSTRPNHSRRQLFANAAIAAYSRRRPLSIGST
jgi:hypothetical protein